MSVPGGRGSAAEKTATRTETGESASDPLELGQRAESRNLARPPKPDPDLLKLGRRIESANLGQSLEPDPALLNLGRRVDSANLGQPLEAGPALLNLGRRVESANLGQPPEAAEVARARTIREKIGRWLEEKL